MKFIALAAIIAVAASSPLNEVQSWPWQVGKVYYYDVVSATNTKFDLSVDNGSGFKAQFIVRVKTPGRLLVKLENPLYKQGEEYLPLKNLDTPFEVLIEGGRVLSLNLPSVSLAYENLLKGLVSALQIDLSTFGNVHSYPNYFNKQTFQGVFKKIETDVTGECETLYSVSPMPAEGRREIPKFTSDDELLEVVKSINYGSCKKLQTFTIGVPEGAVWQGITSDKEERQFITHTSKARIIASKQGTIYKSEVKSSVFVSPLLFGKQKAEVYSYVNFYLNNVELDNIDEWELSENIIQVDSLLYKVTDSTSFFAQGGEQVIENAQKLLQEITPMLQNNYEVPKVDFLSKFNVFVRLLASMTPEQLKEMSSTIEDDKWIIYRDAVAQAGTVAAFQQIKAWIVSEKVKGDEAGQLLTSLASTLYNPTSEVIREFFNFALTPEVKKEQDLNSTALLAVTKLIRNSAEDYFVIDIVIPRLSQELKEAIKNEEYSKAQTYVIVLGNLGHVDVLKVFAPYLEGHITVTKFLRVQMVANLRTLANLKNENVRVALFSILKNTAEPYEVRVAAALNIFMAHPTADMMQEMALMTNNDPSTQVRAALANGIKYAAELKNPRFTELSKTAQSVLNFVTKEKLGYRLSTDSLKDGYTSDDEFSFFRELSYIGSEDHILPKYHRSALRFGSTGLTEENYITFSLSNVQQLVDYFMSLLSESSKTNVDLEFSAEKVAEILNIKRNSPEPLEGSLFIDNMNQQKLITFSESELQSFVQCIRTTAAKFMAGISESYTKVLSQKQVVVSFPLAMGVPFIFEYSEPTLFHFGAQANMKLNPGTFFKIFNTKFEFTYARNMDGRVGFVDTLGNNFVSTGVINKLQINTPIGLKWQTKSEENRITLSIDSNKDVDLIHLSVWPYTTQQKTSSLKTIFEEDSTKFVIRPAKVVSLGQTLPSDIALELEGYSYSADYKCLASILDADIITNVGTLLYQKDIALTEFNLKYSPEESKIKDTTISFVFDQLYDQNVEGEMGPATYTDDVTANSKARREKLAKQVASGIKSAKVMLSDISIGQGSEKYEVVFTSAIAFSNVDNKLQAAVFLHSKNQVNAVFKLTRPAIIPLNFEEALKNEIVVDYEADIKYDKDENIHLQAVGKRSEKYVENLINDPKTKQCQLEAIKGNFYQKDCHKMIIKAHVPDLFEGTVTYTNDGLKRFSGNSILYVLNNAFKQMYGGEQEPELNTETLDDGLIKFEAQVYYYEGYLNYRFITKDSILQTKYVSVLPYLPYGMAFYIPTTTWERSYNWYTNYQYLPFCTVDSSKVSTFSGRSYDYTLTSSWHVVMVDKSSLYKGTNLVILSRRPSENELFVYISYVNKRGETLELEISPSDVNVKENVTNSMDKSSPLLEYYKADVEGVKVFRIDNSNLRILYDGQRLVIFTNEHRSTTNGLCGQSTTEDRDDYMTPWGLVDLPQYYGASFSIENEFSDPKTTELKKEAKLKAYQPFTKFTSILSSDDWDKTENQSFKGL